uniref:Guanylate cyclase n=1 Tax=Plectus sambesii TaxID=2011161 RepID=A0A914VYF3_9BILA
FLTDVGDGVWPFKDGKLPSDTPECGFLGEKCDHKVQIAVGVAIIIIILTVVAILIRFQYYQRKVLRDMPWRLSPKQIKLMRDDKMKTLINSFKSNITDSTAGGDENTAFAKNFAMVGNNYATVRRFDQKKTVHFRKDELHILYEMKQVTHDNLNSFLGICCNNTGLEMLILWKYCQRGTLSDFIHNEDIQMDMRFKTSFIRDVAQGLDYLHTSTIGYHSCLTPTTTLIDNNWVVKLSDYGLEGFLERLIKDGCVSSKALSVSPVEQFYIAPEELRIKKMHPLRQQPSQDRLKRIQEKQMADIYSFGIVLWEILFRAQPFDDAGKGPEVVVERICDYNPLKEAEPYRPSVPQCATSEYHPDLLSTMRLCWAEMSDERPTMKRVRKLFETSLRTKGGLVDQMMAMMEQYANNLEKLVKERTMLLEETQQRADRLLRQLLPREVANELKLGRAVPPRSYEAASVQFTDIVGFTALCSSSTPMEIVGFLNQIFSGFDNVVSEHDAYKVETIGDAYLVVSGVPKENGSNHVKICANISLKMKAFVSSFELAHRPGHRLQCRWGIHTGPVAAGVVGLTAPRYCLFGDTVNMASRMESTGMADHIQISESSFFLLTGSYPGFFRCKQRGQVEVKGKGLCTTYILEGRESDLQQQEKANATARGAAMH